MTLAEFVLAWRALAPVVKGKCFYCGRQMDKSGKPSHASFMTRDHVVPASSMRYHTASESTRTPHGNRVICCRKCNSKKSDLTMQEFKQRTGIATFYAEKLLDVRIDDLSDINEVTLFILNARKSAECSIKSHEPEPSAEPQDSTPPSTSDSQQG